MRIKNTIKITLQNACILFILHGLIYFVGDFIAGFWEKLAQRSPNAELTTHNIINIICLIAIVLCNFLFVMYKSKRKSSDLTGSTITIISLEIELFFALTSIFGHKNFDAISMMSSICFPYLLNYFSLSFANYLFNWPPKGINKFSIYNALLIPLLMYSSPVTVIDKNAWSKNFKNHFGEWSCAKVMDDPIVKSKQISHAQCLSLMSDSMDRCIDKFNIPDKIKIEEGKNFGAKVGLCVSGDFFGNLFRTTQS